MLTRTVELGEACRAQSWKSVLCHADAHVGNVLLEPDGRLHLIDWDAPRIAPRERDLMFVTKGGIASEHGPAEEAAFIDGYGPASPDPLALAYYRYAWATDDLASYSDETLHPAPDDPTQGGKALHYFAHLFEPGQIVASAFAHDHRESQ